VVSTFTWQYAFGPLMKGLALVLDLFSAEASLGLCIALALFFALPQTLRRTLVLGRLWRARGRDDGA
jgi:hypothetical protein